MHIVHGISKMLVASVILVVLLALGGVPLYAQITEEVTGMETEQFVLPPYPLEEQVTKIMDAPGPEDFEPTGIDKEFYMDLSERVARQTVKWQQPNGAIVNPILGRETSTTSARFVGALGTLIWAGRCKDLVENCALSMDYCCAIMAGEQEPGGPFSGPEFYTKELMFAYFALEGKVDDSRRQNWARQLECFDPWQRYHSWRNWADSNFPIYAVCGEWLKRYAGIIDHQDHIDAVLDNQFKLINPYGLYRDPHDPFTYDLTDRHQLGMIMQYGYEGRHHDWIDEATRRGGLTQLLYSSVTGQMPYGGRSNQYHIMEAMSVAICEMEARRYKDTKPEWAGAFKRAAHLAAKSVESWVMDYDPAFITKNRFSAESAHGDSGYDGSPYTAYYLLMGSVFGTAYQLADESIPEAPAPVDKGGYVMQLWPSFHRTFATCGDYHIEIDNRGQITHDATGLGRIHKRGIRPETGLSMSIPANPAVRFSMPTSPEYAAIGPVVKWGMKYIPLAEMADSKYCQGIFAADLRIIEESPERVAFSLTYSGDLLGAQSITETYEVTPDGVTIEPSIVGGELAEFRVPLIVTDGMGTSGIETRADGFSVTYEGAVYDVSVDDAEGITTILDSVERPNISGVYRLGKFVGPVAGRTFTLTLREAAE